MIPQDAEGRDLHLLSTYCMPDAELAHPILIHTSPPQLFISYLSHLTDEKGREGQSMPSEALLLLSSVNLSTSNWKGRAVLRE